jgi:hypothetical protein
MASHPKNPPRSSGSSLSIRKVITSRRSRNATAPLSGDRFDIAAKESGGVGRFSEGCKRPVACRKFAGAELIRSPLVTAPPYQRSNELTRKGSAPVVAGAAVLSTTTLVPTRARL